MAQGFFSGGMRPVQSLRNQTAQVHQRYRFQLQLLCCLTPASARRSSAECGRGSGLPYASFLCYAVLSVVASANGERPGG